MFIEVTGEMVDIDTAHVNKPTLAVDITKKYLALMPVSSWIVMQTVRMYILYICSRVIR